MTESNQITGQEARNAEITKSHDIVKMYNVDDYYASEEMKEIYSGFQGREQNERIGRKYFSVGFVTSADPEKNYGRSFNLWKLYKTNEGLMIISMEKLGSSLTNHGLQIGNYNMGEVSDDGTLKGGTISETSLYVDNSKANRKALGQLWLPIIKK